ncbi:amidohydrolase [Limosilactobacillus caviae]|uniref:amidohydrolase n=1 Tax=Limosilactobacillus caviae TaxID=1769424 RepID=UPI00129A30D5|nr:amidohydrolase [Limosilactobacillus caviae]MCD7123531.1 amidohydrolase [Limosilactobacillus caviae]MRH46235.1 amidohydrolase [Limosilactobacillus reuteri]
MNNELQIALMKKLDEHEDEIIKIRRYLHAHPETSFHEKNTARYIKEFYRHLDCDLRDCGDGYGILVDIHGARPGKCLALRADFDALAIQEDNNLPFRSQNPGVMHACGHDGHTAYMMVLAKCLIELKEMLNGTVRIIHQPAEEVSPGGALSMIQDGALDGVDNVVGIHVMSTMPTGTIQLHPGPTQTGRANFDLTFVGKGGHASMPQLSHDAIVAGSYFVTTVQTVVSRRLNPFDVGSVTIGSFDGAGSYNAIKESVSLKGDVRIMDEKTRGIIKSSIQKVIKGIDDSFDVHSKLKYDDNYPVLDNSRSFTAEIEKWLKEAKLPRVTAIKDSGFVNASEDFSYFAQVVPSCFFYVGCQPADGGSYPHHSPEFMLNEKSLLICAKAMGTVVTNYFALR